MVRRKEAKGPGGSLQSQLNIRLPERVMEALEADAERCLRSNTKQVEAILTAYYGIADVDIRDPEDAKAKVGTLSHKAFLRAAVGMVAEARHGASGEHADFLDDSLGMLKGELEKHRA